MASSAARQPDMRFREPHAVISELIEIADYIAHLREEIGALRANEMSRDRIPMAHEELSSACLPAFSRITIATSRST